MVNMEGGMQIQPITFLFQPSPAGSELKDKVTNTRIQDEVLPEARWA